MCVPIFPISSHLLKRPQLLTKSTSQLNPQDARRDARHNVRAVRAGAGAGRVLGQLDGGSAPQQNKDSMFAFSDSGPQRHYLAAKESIDIPMCQTRQCHLRSPRTFEGANRILDVNFRPDGASPDLAFKRTVNFHATRGALGPRPPF